MDLSKAYDFLHHDLSISKFEAYGLITLAWNSSAVIFQIESNE